MKVKVNTIKLGDIVKYSDDRISCDVLTTNNYVGTDNILQNKAGKENSQYVPSNGKVIKFQQNDILVANIRPYLQKIWFADRQGGSSADVSVIRVIDSKFEPKFVYYNLFQDIFFDYATKGAKGSKMPRLDKNQILGFPVAAFKPSTQKAIADVLSSIDDKISLNYKINSELEQTSQIIFDYWFMQYDYPDTNGRPYKSSGGAMTYNSQLKKEIPTNWKVVSLRDLISVSKNGDWGKASLDEECIEVYCVRGADISGLNGFANFNPPIRFIEASHSDRLLKENDLVVEISGGSPTQSTGRMAHISSDVVNRLKNKVVCSNFCKAISLKNVQDSYIVNQYWNRLYESGVFFNFEGKTSGIKNLMFDQLVRDVKIAIPNDGSLTDAYYNIAASIDAQKQINLTQNQELGQLRDWLLPMLMTGQVKTGE
jgi:type I restriction enzyme S subunit